MGNDLGWEAMAAIAERSIADILSDTPPAPDPPFPVLAFAEAYESQPGEVVAVTTSKVGAERRNAARPVLRGRCPVMGIPTAI